MSKQNSEISDIEMSKVVGGIISPSQYGTKSNIICPECKGEVPISFLQLLQADSVFCPNCGLRINLHKNS